MIRLIAVAAFALAVATSAQAMSRVPLHQPDGMTTQVRYYGYRHYGYRHYGYRHTVTAIGPTATTAGIGTTAIGPTSMDPPAAMPAEFTAGTGIETPPN